MSTEGILECYSTSNSIGQTKLPFPNDWFSINECESLFPFEEHSIDDFWQQEEEYLENLVLLHNKYTYLEDHIGNFITQAFLPETVEETYNKNLYAISHFYHGDMHCDKYEQDYEAWMQQQWSNKTDED